MTFGYRKLYYNTVSQTMKTFDALQSTYDTKSIKPLRGLTVIFLSKLLDKKTEQLQYKYELGDAKIVDNNFLIKACSFSL